MRSFVVGASCLCIRGGQTSFLIQFLDYFVRPPLGTLQCCLVKMGVAELVEVGELGEAGFYCVAEDGQRREQG